MLHIQILENGTPVSTLKVEGDEILEGEIPIGLRRSVENLQQLEITLEEYLLRIANGMGNMSRLENGNGLLIVSQT
ncbi:hypothetical protein H6G00_01540 [Leptolyngbya sp. FACHB-541]|uniref:hypothetical protein n=1 Tax=Leptolyngbya sp. FACHB-541 TaxID=2692810 RepID=UPI00168256CB|nr:hypothetical protein [Leptolyngbya sp. FACHB-541]MBD1995313.1 hypothetical protein [Leptolyngbya sp. FACHB-541]